MSEDNKQRISKEQADNILKLDLANILKKVKAGKPLTNAERKLVEGGGIEEPQSMEQIAEALGVTRQTLYNLIKEYPDDCPKGKARRYLSAWKTAVGIIRKSGKDTKADDTTRAGMQVKKIKLEVEAMQIKLDREKGLLISSEDFSATIIGLCSKAKQHLRWALETKLPPRLEGLSAGEIREKCKEACDEVCNILSNSDFYNVNYDTEQQSTIDLEKGLATS